MFFLMILSYSMNFKRTLKNCEKNVCDRSVTVLLLRYKHDKERQDTEGSEALPKAGGFL